MSGGFGAMGFGLPAAMGAAVANPGAVVVDNLVHQLLEQPRRFLNFIDIKSFTLPLVPSKPSMHVFVFASTALSHVLKSELRFPVLLCFLAMPQILCFSGIDALNGSFGSPHPPKPKEKAKLLRWGMLLRSGNFTSCTRREEREEHVKERVDVGLRVLRSEEGVYEGSEDSEMRVHKVNVKERREGCGQ
ncbi:hypothetical protein ACSQ67_020025 [Phaseolus vulgaris]